MLTQNLLNQERKIKLRWFVALSTLPLLGVVTAFGLAPQSDLGSTEIKVAIEEIALPKITPVPSAITSFWRNERVQRGDTVVELLRRLNVEDAAASDYLRASGEAESFRKLSIGKEIQAETNSSGGLIDLRYPGSNGTQIMIEKQDSGFTAKILPALLEKRLLARTGEIKTSLYAATDAVDIPDAIADQLAELF